jgi:biopolymer transport protein ExbB
LARNLQNSTQDTGYLPAIVDPSRGALLGVYVERPSLWERVQEGEVVVYVILAVGIIGVLAAAFQYVYLFIAKIAVNAQLKHLSTPVKNNALGRMLLAVKGDSTRDFHDELPEVVELRISEAVLREIPKLERFQSFLRLAVAAGPLLGLIGTVIGMILTFQSITASGSSDPKLMAQGIGQAMIATVMGLGVAIPLLFLNAGLVSLSKSVVHVLEEESTNLMADRLVGKS